MKCLSVDDFTSILHNQTHGKRTGKQVNLSIQSAENEREQSPQFIISLQLRNFPWCE